MRKKLKGIGTIFLVLFGLSACLPTMENPDSDSIEQTTLVVWAWDRSFYIPAVQLAADYYRNSGYDRVMISVEEVPEEELVLRLEDLFESGQTEKLPDIILSEDENARYLLTHYERRFVDLSNHISGNQFADYKISAVSKDGRIYGVPFNSGIVGLFYRKKPVEQAGYTEEQMSNLTWNEFLEVATKLREQSGMPVFPAFGYDYSEILQLMMQAAGKTFFDEAGDIYLRKNVALRESSQVIKEMFDRELVEDPSKDSGQSIIQQEELIRVSTFKFVESLKAAEVPAGEWTYVRPPKLESVPNATHYGSKDGASWFVLQASENKETAVDFLKQEFAGNMELYHDLLSNYAEIGTMVSLYDGGIYQKKEDILDDKKVYEDFSTWATEIPSLAYNPYQRLAEDALLSVFDDYLTGKLNLDEMLQKAEDQFQTLRSKEAEKHLWTE